VAQGVQFDLDGDGDLDRVGWVGANDGLLVRDLNGNGFIDGGQELFGDATQLADGSLAQDGFQALAALDQDGDGWVSAADAGFGQLSVWRDANQDGVADAGEVLSLEAVGITRLEVTSEQANLVSEGNRIGLTASFERADGSRSTVADVWLRFIEADSSDERAVMMGDALAGYQRAGPETPAATGVFGARVDSSRLKSVSPVVASPEVQWVGVLGDALASYQREAPRGLEQVGDTSPFSRKTAEDEAKRRGSLVSPQGFGGSPSGQ